MTNSTGFASQSTGIGIAALPRDPESSPILFLVKIITHQNGRRRFTGNVTQERQIV